MPIADGSVFVSSEVTSVHDKWTVHGTNVEGERLPLARVLEILERNKPPPTATIIVQRTDADAKASAKVAVPIDVDPKRDVESTRHISGERGGDWRGWKTVRVAGGDKLVLLVHPGKYRVRAMSRACAKRLCPEVEVDAVVGPPMRLTAAASGRVELQRQDR
jgi:hypothetical protein